MRFYTSASTHKSMPSSNVSHVFSTKSVCPVTPTVRLVCLFCAVAGLTTLSCTSAVFICIFLIFFAGVVMTIMSIFGGLSPSSMVSGAVMGIRNLASRVNNISKFATNRMNRIQDKKAKKLIEEAKGGGNVDAVKLEHAKNRLEDRGYLKQDKDGKMHETSAYRTMDKRGAFASMQRLSADLGMSSSQQREMRAGDGNELENELKV